MTSHALCITHSLPNLPSCVKRDAHLVDCADDQCSGCAPREAALGFLCVSCWERLEEATSKWDYTFSPWLGGETRAVQPESGSGTSKPGSRLPLTPLQLTFDEVLRLMASRTGALRLWGTTTQGAIDAVEFTRAVERAVLAFPTAEEPRAIRTTRCPKCARRSLVYQPAQTFGGAATVQCLSSDCNNVMDHSSFERIALIEAQCCRRCRGHDGCTNSECTCHRVAPVPEWQRTNKPSEEQPFAPLDNPQHADLDILTTVPSAELRKRALELEIPRARYLRKADLITSIREAEQS